LVATECKEICPTIRTHVLTCDLSDKASVQQLGEQALKVCDNTIDVLINNGGVSSRGNFVDTTIDVDEKVMQINFLSGAALAKAVAPTMINNQSGKIIWISSIQGLIGIPSRTSYGASKFAVEGYCQSLRAELASSGVTVHVISPGYIRTNLSRSALKGWICPWKVG
jgi:dehydrogenase/reductase SDR family protein 7B